MLQKVSLLLASILITTSKSIQLEQEGEIPEGFPTGATEDQAWAELAQSPTDQGWFQTATYQSKTASDKMADLW